MNFNFISIGSLIDSKEASLQTGPFGTQLKASEYVESGTPVINVRNIGFGDIRADNLEFITDFKAEQLKNHILCKDDIVFGRKGAVERHSYIQDEQVGWVQGSDCLRLRLNTENVDSRFLSYYFKTQPHQDWMHALCAFGATMASLNQDIVRRILFPCPSISVQRQIVAILSAYDDLIENNKKRIQILENMAEELYKEWFVRFRFPNWENTEFEKGIPKDWKIEKISNLVDRKKFGRVYKEYELCLEADIPVIDQSQKTMLGFHEGEAEHIASFESPMIIFGDHSCKMQIMFKNFSLAENVIPFKSKHNILLLYLFSLIKDQVETTEYKRHWGELTNKKVLVAPLTLQEKYTNLIIDKMKLIEILKTKNSLLVNNRDQLLPRLISGKLSVENLDIQFPPSMQES
ncbi:MULTISPECIES: restriction endonuclease subunit S [Acinetobacter]|uniref:restriction endonuclease subunit S n=1 Tax=Acinetobacter TaxID=469 RepID=UPI00051B44EA|nr:MULTISPECIES: restriction endonuclease subunit S [Acinetobacter]MCH7379466.1 restriction endonuclease subunit S [Acinetobacter higginsii]MCJ0828977.1 restriction endonuclease subunit S [Acinetobacter sp. NIPH1876]